MRKKNKNVGRLNIAVVPSFFVGDDGEVHYQASVHPTEGDEPAWLAVLFGRVGSAPEMISPGSDVPVAYRAQIAGAVQQCAQTEFDKLVSAVISGCYDYDSHKKAVIQ